VVPPLYLIAAAASLCRHLDLSLDLPHIFFFCPYLFMHIVDNFSFFKSGDGLPLRQAIGIWQLNAPRDHLSDQFHMLGCGLRF